MTSPRNTTVKTASSITPTRQVTTQSDIFLSLSFPADDITENPIPAKAASAKQVTTVIRPMLV